MNTATRTQHGPTDYERAFARVHSTPALELWRNTFTRPGYEHGTPSGVWRYIADAPLIIVIGYMLQNTNADGRGYAPFGGRTGRVGLDVSGYDAGPVSAWDPSRLETPREHERRTGAPARYVECSFCGDVVHETETIGTVCRPCVEVRGHGDSTAPDMDVDTALDAMFARYGVRPAWCPGARVWRVEHTFAPAQPYDRYVSFSGFRMSGQYNTFADTARAMRVRFPLHGRSRVHVSERVRRSPGTDVSGYAVDLESGRGPYQVKTRDAVSGVITTHRYDNETDAVLRYVLEVIHGAHDRIMVFAPSGLILWSMDADPETGARMFGGHRVRCSPGTDAGACVGVEGGAL